MPARRTIGYIAARLTRLRSGSATSEPVGAVAPGAARGATTADAAQWDSVRY